jgi:hypothetical protein
MPTRPVAAIAVLLVTLAGCTGAPAATGPAGTAGTTGSPASQTPTAGATIDLSKLDACALVATSVVEGLTGETGFTTDRTANASSSTCFWAVPRAGVPQYVEIQVNRRTASLGDYSLNVNGAACPGLPIPGVGAEARGGVCVGAQKKVWLIAMDQGVSVQVIVNEPKGELTPADLVAAVSGVLAGLG